MNIIAVGVTQGAKWGPYAWPTKSYSDPQHPMPNSMVGDLTILVLSQQMLVHLWTSAFYGPQLYMAHVPMKVAQNILIILSLIYPNIASCRQQQESNGVKIPSLGSEI